LCDVKVLYLILNNVNIQAQFHEIRDEKVQVHEVKNKVHDSMQDLGGSMTRKILNKTQEDLQYKVTYMLKAQLLKNNHIEEIRLITYIIN